MKNGKLIIVSNRLPVSIEQSQEGLKIKQSSGGLVSAIMGYLETEFSKSRYSSVVWVGVPDSSRTEWEKIQPLLKDSLINYLPVFLDKLIKEAFYNRFSNSTIWPLFHYFPSYTEFREEDFLAYQLANEKFADVLYGTIEERDTVWVQDYHLLLLPAILRQNFSKIPIAFFLHIPFPAFDIFRLLPNRWRRDLVNGMLGADLIGFQTQDDVINYLQSVQRLVGIQVLEGRLHVNHRLVQAAAFPISIDFDKFNGAAKSVPVEIKREELRNSLLNKKIIFSVDRLDYTKGVMDRLQAYALFLNQYPEYRKKVVFILNIVPSRDAISKYSERKKMIDEFVGNLNAKIGDIAWQPVIYRYQHLEFTELVALYTTCDIAIISPLRDGMNLVAKEFVASRHENNGVLLLSEFAGASKELTNALIINPNDLERFSRKIHRAIIMTDEEQRIRMSRMREYLSENNVSQWAKSIFDNLSDIKFQQDQFKPSILRENDIIYMQQYYHECKRRLILLDYDGTLVNLEDHPDLAIPTQKVLEVLKSLTADKDNTVFIVSGRKRQNLENWLNNIPIGFVAEHGAFIKWPGGEWIQRTSPVQSWKKEAMVIMNRFASANPGSFIEEKENAIAWHYRNLGEMIARDAVRELYYQLQMITSKPGAEVIHGHKVVEIRSRGASKGAAYSEIAAMSSFDFILAIGDDRTDEDLFYRLTGRNCFTIRVGSAASFARYNVPEPSDVIDLLTRLVSLNLERSGTVTHD